MEIKSKRGGKREGAGRKPTNMGRHNIMLSPEDVKKALTFAKSLSEGIRVALRML